MRSRRLAAAITPSSGKFLNAIISMAKTEIILTHNVVGLGAESDQIKVAAGYARNYLFPQGLAIPLTAANKRRLEALRQRRAEREAHEFNTMSELAKGLSKMVLMLTVKTGDGGKLFGTVTPGAIADEMKHQFDVSIDKKKIHLDHPIKTVGEHNAEIRLHPDVVVTLKVRVESSTPLSKPAEASAAGAKPESTARVEGKRERPARKPRAEKLEKTG